jgi:hypothetical protein
MAKRPKMSYKVMDIFQMPYAPGTFDYILDKGALDAVYPPDVDEKALQNVHKMLTDCHTILKPNGSYLIVSLLQEFILKKILDTYIPLNCSITIHEVILKKSKHMPFLVQVQKNGNPSLVTIKYADGKTVQTFPPGKVPERIKLLQLQNTMNKDMKKIVMGIPFTRLVEQF